MKLIQAVPLLACYLAFCSCSGENNGGHSHDHPHNHEHNHEHNHSHEGEGKKTPAKKPESKPSEKKNVKLDSKEFDHFGEGAHEGEAVSMEELTANVAKYDGKWVRLKSTVAAVCKNKGCWVELGEGPKKMRVKFKDYGFFLPKDCEGRAAIFEGTFNVGTESVAEQKHYLEDAGKPEEAAKITEPKKTLKFMADGVALAKKTG